VTTSERESIPLTTEAELGVKFGSQVNENAETGVAGNELFILSTNDLVEEVKGLRVELRSKWILYIIPEWFF
jgi:hypothetical protein